MDIELLNKYMNWLSTFEKRFTKDVCKILFPADHEHMWYIWIHCNYSLVTYYGCMSKEYKLKLITWGYSQMPQDLAEKFKKI